MKHMNHQNMNHSQVMAVLKMKTHFYLRPQNESFVKCPVFDFDVSEDESNEDLEKSISEVIETIFSPKGKKYFIKIQAFVVNFYQPYKRNLG